MISRNLDLKILKISILVVLATVMLAGCVSENIVESVSLGGYAVVLASGENLNFGDRVGVYQRVCKLKMKSGRVGISHDICKDLKVVSGNISRRLSNTEIELHTDREIQFVKGLVVRKD